MSLFKFDHIYYALLTTAALCAFVLPTWLTEKFEPNIQSLFAPVSRPVGAIAGWATGRWAPEPVRDTRPDADIRRQNDRLALENVKLRHDLEELARRDGERRKMGVISPDCTRVSVVGADLGQRESLAVQASSLTGIGGQNVSADRTYFVLYPQGVVGTLRVGTAGGQVRLVTDPSFKVEAYFSGFRNVPTTRPAGGKPAGAGESRPVRLIQHPLLVRGAGRGKMVCQMMTMEAVAKAGIVPGDWVMLQDPDWPQKLHGQRIGTVTKIAPRRDGALFAEITIEPADNLLRLQEVMVLTEEK